MSRPSNKQNGEVCTVFIADTNLFHCQLLADSLGRNHIRVVGWAVDSDEAIACIRRQTPDVAVISSRMQDGEQAGFHVLEQVRRGGSDTRIVMLLDASEPDVVVEAFRAGAAGVFPRTRVSTDLRKCIRCVLAGEIWARHEEIRYVMEALRRPAPHISNSQGIALLTRREEDVVALVVDGLTNREIAAELRLSEHTIKNYMFEIFEKLGVSTRVELALYALNHQRRAPGSVPATQLSGVSSVLLDQRSGSAGDD